LTAVSGEVLEEGDIVLVHGIRIDVDGLQLAIARNDHLDGTPPETVSMVFWAMEAWTASICCWMRCA
jgi:hypothetical protein